MSVSELVDFYVSGARNDWRYKDEGKVAYRVIMCVKADPRHDWTDLEFGREFKRHLDDWTEDDWATAVKCAAISNDTGVYRREHRHRRRGPWRWLVNQMTGN